MRKGRAGSPCSQRHLGVVVEVRAAHQIVLPLLVSVFFSVVNVMVTVNSFHYCVCFILSIFYFLSSIFCFSFYSLLFLIFHNLFLIQFLNYLIHCSVTFYLFAALKFHSFFIAIAWL